MSSASRSRVPRVKESTALGAALFAGLGVGLYQDIERGDARAVQLRTDVRAGWRDP